jgi:hypothetical protein
MHHGFAGVGFCSIRTQFGYRNFSAIAVYIAQEGAVAPRERALGVQIGVGNRYRASGGEGAL